MSRERPPPSPSWARDHLANERTLLAWLRTALAFMAFGVALAKLAVLVRVASMEHPAVVAQLPDQRVSGALGAGLVALGGLVAILGTVHARRWSREIAPDHPPPRQAALLAMGGLTIAIALALLLYLVV